MKDAVHSVGRRRSIRTLGGLALQFGHHSLILHFHHNFLRPRAPRRELAKHHTGEGEPSPLWAYLSRFWPPTAEPMPRRPTSTRDPATAPAALWTLCAALRYRMTISRP